MAEVIVVAEENVEGSKVLLPITTTSSPSPSAVVLTGEDVVRGADVETGTEDVMVLPELSVVVTGVLDSGVSDGVADVPVSSSVAEVSDGCSEVGVVVGAVVEPPSVGVVGPASVVVGSVVGAVVGSVSEVVGAVVVALVSEVVGSEDVVSELVVGVTELLVVTPVPTTCRFGMTP